MIHDLEDAARFKVSRQIKTDRLLEQLLQCGADGIRGLVECLARAAATGRTLLTDNQYDGYDIVVEWKRKLQKYSSSLLEGLPGSISNDWNQLFYERYLHYRMREFRRFQRLDYLESLFYQIIGCTRLQAPAGVDHRLGIAFLVEIGHGQIVVGRWVGFFQFQSPPGMGGRAAIVLLAQVHLPQVVVELGIPFGHRSGAQIEQEEQSRESRSLQCHVAVRAQPGLLPEGDQRPGSEDEQNG